MLLSHVSESMGFFCNASSQVKMNIFISEAKRSYLHHNRRASRRLQHFATSKVCGSLGEFQCTRRKFCASATHGFWNSQILQSSTVSRRATKYKRCVELSVLSGSNWRPLLPIARPERRLRIGCHIDPVVLHLESTKRKHTHRPPLWPSLHSKPGQRRFPAS